MFGMGMGKMGLAKSAVAFAVSSLFANGEQGVWYDPSDINLAWRRNLLTYTEQFDNAAWAKTGLQAFGSGSTANATIAPDGTQTADLLTESATSGNHRAIQTLGTLQPQTITVAIRHKAGPGGRNTDFAIVGGSNYVSTRFSTATGEALLSDDLVGSVFSGKQVSVSGPDAYGFFTATISVTILSVVSVSVVCGLVNGTSNNYVGNGTSGIYIWGAQLEVGSTASTYQRITDGVQDYYAYQAQPVLFQDSAGTTPVTAVEQPVGLMLDKSKGLVLGPELVVSQDLTNAQWAQLPATPASTTTATTLTFGGQFSGRADTISVSSGKAYLFSFEARRVSGNTNLRIYYDSIQQTNGAVDFTVDGNWKTVSRVVFATSTLVDFGWQDRNASGHGTIELRNISVRELPGNHAFQSTSTSRPVLSARYNLLTKTEQFDDAAWTKSNVIATANATTAPDGTLTADALIENTTNAQHQWYQQPTVIAATHIFSLYAKRISGSSRYFAIYPQGATAAWAVFDLTTGTITATGGANYSASSITSVGDGWYKCSVTFTTIAASLFSTLYLTNSSGSPSNSYTGDGTSGIYIWGADLRVTNDAAGQPAYQRVNTATDYDTTGFKPYLRFDGTDDWLQTNSINFTGTDKMTVFAGVRKLSDAARGILVELSASAGTNAGAFLLSAPEAASASFGAALSTGGTARTQSFVTYTAPLSAVLVQQSDGSKTSIQTAQVVSVNGTVATSADTGAMSPGNFGNYPLYIGRRGGTTLPFNGRIYGLIVRGAQSTAQQITDSEKYMAALVGTSAPAIQGVPTIGVVL